MAIITLAELKAYWQKVSDWVDGTDVVSAPKITINSSALPTGAATSAKQPDLGTALIAASTPVNIASDQIVNTALTGSTVADAQASLIPGMGYNGATYDRWRNNMQGEILASAARTINTSGPTITNYNARGVSIELDITVSSGTGGLKIYVFVLTSTGKTIVYTSNLPATSITAIGRHLFLFYPGIVESTAYEGAVAIKKSIAIPRQFSIVVIHADASSYTYGVTYSLIV